MAQIVIDTLEDRDMQDRYHLSVAGDGDAWLVSQALPNAPDARANGAVVVTRGGGGIFMRIVKCDGAISQVHFQR